jgi:hypothetical protein
VSGPFEPSGFELSSPPFDPQAATIATTMATSSAHADARLNMFSLRKPVALNYLSATEWPQWLEIVR